MSKINTEREAYILAGQLLERDKYGDVLDPLAMVCLAERIITIARRKSK